MKSLYESLKISKDIMRNFQLLNFRMASKSPHLFLKVNNNWDRIVAVKRGVSFTLLCFFLLISIDSRSQAFTGTYTIGKTAFKVKPVSDDNRDAGIYNIIYTKSDRIGTLANLSDYDHFEFAFDEFVGDIYLGTFFFTKAWKGKPLEGYYIRAKTKNKIKVKFLKE